MSRRHYDLPPLTTLSAFEVAARHLSFKDAAQELGVTPGAVSHQIKALEGDLGMALFQRQHRGVTLTDEGQALFETLGSSFGRISRRLEAIREKDTTNKITVGSTTAVAAFWLSPAIVRFWRNFPDISVDQLTQDTVFSPRVNLDFVIRYGRDHNKKLAHTALFRDELVLVGSPAQAETLQDMPLAELANRWLIHMESDGRDWTTLTDWFRHLGHQGHINKGTRVTNYSVALQLAREGTGLTLGWRRLIQPMLENRELAVIGKHTLPAPREFYLVEYARDDMSASGQRFKDWILADIPKHLV